MATKNNTGKIVLIGGAAAVILYLLYKKSTTATPPATTSKPLTTTATTPAATTASLLGSVSALIKQLSGGGGSTPAKAAPSLPSGGGGGGSSAPGGGGSSGTSSIQELPEGFYAETEANGTTTVYDEQGNAYNNATINSDGTVDIPTANGTYMELDPSDNSTTYYDANGNDLSSSNDTVDNSENSFADSVALDGVRRRRRMGAPFSVVQSELVNFPQKSPTPSSVV